MLRGIVGRKKPRCIISTVAFEPVAAHQGWSRLLFRLRSSQHLGPMFGNSEVGKDPGNLTIICGFKFLNFKSTNFGAGACGVISDGASVELLPRFAAGVIAADPSRSADCSAL